MGPFIYLFIYESPLNPDLVELHWVAIAQRLKRLPAMQETWVRSLGREDPLEKEMATHSRILAWRIPWAEEPGGVAKSRTRLRDFTSLQGCEDLTLPSSPQLTLGQPRELYEIQFPHL